MSPRRRTGPAQALSALFLKRWWRCEPRALRGLRGACLALLLEIWRLAEFCTLGWERPQGRGRPARAAPGRLGRWFPGGVSSRPAALISRWWPEGATPGWPAALGAGITWKDASAAGIGRATAIEVTVNAILPVALASGVIPVADVEAAWRALPSPGTYGRLARLQSWLGGEHNPPFTSACRLQGGLLLHGDYCTRGACGRCPFSD